MAIRVAVIDTPAMTLGDSASFSAAVAAHAARQLDERLFGVADVGDAAVLRDPEAHRGLFLSGVIEQDRIVMNDLDHRVDLLHLDRDRHRRLLDGEIVLDVDRVFAGHDAANADRLLADRAHYLFAVHHDAVVDPAAVVAIEHHESRLAGVIPD